MSALPPFTDVPTALEEFRAGRMIIVVDDEDRENEGDLTLAAEKVTPEAINFMAREGVSTGISAFDRARTIQVAIDPRTRPGDLARPGHVFPLRARKGGVLVRAGQTEAAVDLARMAGMVPAGVI